MELIDIINDLRAKYETMLRDAGADERTARMLGNAYATGCVEYEMALVEHARTLDLPEVRLQ